MFWTFIQQVVATLLSTAAVAAAIAWFGGQWIDATIKARFDRILEDYRFELRAKEQGSKIAEYAAWARDLKLEDNDETYRRANQLAWELFLWLPEDVYRKLGRGLAVDNKELFDAMVDVRKALLKDRAGNLGINDVIFHGRGIGAKKQ